MSRDIVDISTTPDWLVAAVGIEVSWRISWPVSRSMIRISRSAIRSLTRRPLWALPTPMWWSLLSWRKVIVFGQCQRLQVVPRGSVVAMR